MKKITLFAATALAITGIGGHTITAQAATQNGMQWISKDNVIIGYGSNCNAEDILGQLSECFPNISFPNCELPGVGNPENTPSNPGNDSTEDITPENKPENDSTTEHAFLQEVVDLVNAERAKEGLAPLSVNTNVQAAAMVRAKECEQVFSHTRPDGSSFSTALKEQNVSYKSAGENIAWGQKSPQEVMNAWMNSSGHRANIMNPNFTTIGVGYYENANGTDYWCQLFTR